MLEALQAVPRANRCLPFVRKFYAWPLEFVWHDVACQPHAVTQAEGGEQGDPLTPALFSLGRRAALAEVQARLAPSELLLAFFDDVCVIARPTCSRTLRGDTRTSVPMPAKPGSATWRVRVGLQC